MKNYRIKGLILIIPLFLSCKRKYETPPHKEIIKQSLPLEKEKPENKKDTISVEITSDNFLQVKDNNQQINIDFFSPIKEKIENEDSYAQIIYEKNNIVINIESGQNANVYEDFYLSKTFPPKIEKVKRTTIEKIGDFPTKLECVQAMNKIIESETKYFEIDKNKEKCTEKKLD